LSVAVALWNQRLAVPKPFFHRSTGAERIASIRK
jgi:hypothetical protein